MVLILLLLTCPLYAMFRVNHNGLLIRTFRFPAHTTLHAHLDQVTATIRESSAALLGAYAPETLYAWRVAARRIRSLLKPLTGKRTRRLRRSWGAFVRVTSHARDWDVFLRTATELLPPEQSRQFETDNEAHIGRSRAAVLDMLASDRWSAHLDDWAAWLERAGHHEHRGRPASLPRAMSRARRALATARELGDSRAWHKFRIAMKEVRYLAEAGSSHPDAEGRDAGAYHAALVERCKELQSLLGAWHDCVVQSHLLIDLAPTAVHDALLMAIRDRQEHQLAAIVAAVSDQPLFPVP